MTPAPGTFLPPCLVCGEPTAWERLHRLPMGDLGRCPSCGLVRVLPPRAPSVLAALHATTHYFRHPYFEARRSETPRARADRRQLLERALDGRPAVGLRHLDIGCDTGDLLAAGRDELGLDPVGLEISPLAARTARERHGLDVVVGDVLEAPLEARFDVITAIDVLEHVADPRALLQRLRDLLAPRGRLFLVTPNSAALVYGIGRALEPYVGRIARPLLERLYIPQHETYFSRENLAQLVRAVGLRVVRQELRELRLVDLGHRWPLKIGLAPVFAAQVLLGRQSNQELWAERR